MFFLLNSNRSVFSLPRGGLSFCADAGKKRKGERIDRDGKQNDNCITKRMRRRRTVKQQKKRGFQRRFYADDGEKSDRKLYDLSADGRVGFKADKAPFNRVPDRKPDNTAQHITTVRHARRGIFRKKRIRLDNLRREDQKSDRRNQHTADQDRKKAAVFAETAEKRGKNRQKTKGAKRRNADIKRRVNAEIQAGKGDKAKKQGAENAQALLFCPKRTAPEQTRRVLRVTAG